MADVAEVVVRAVPEGVNETTDELDEMSGKVSESTDEMQEQSEGMSELAESFDGAMSAVVAGLAVATGGLLSQVPVIGESMSGLGAIIDVLALKIDGVLRPVLGRANNILFDLAGTLARTDGIVADFIGVISLLSSAILGAVVAYTGWQIASLGVVAGLKATGAAILTVLGYIGTFVAALVSLPVLLAAAVVGLTLLAFHFRHEIGQAVLDGIQAIHDFVGQVGPAIDALATRVKTKFDAIIRDAKEWGRSLIRQFIQGIKDMIPNVANVVSGINIAPGVTIGDVTGAAGTAADIALGGGGGGGDGFIGSVASGVGDIFLDGQRVSDNQGRYSKDRLTRRGG
jgi:hypothetical protein